MEAKACNRNVTWCTAELKVENERMLFWLGRWTERVTCI